MDDELVIGGRQYISSKRAAALSKYSKDYIGQMCRSGKLEGRLVGRNWYIDPRSLRSLETRNGDLRSIEDLVHEEQKLARAEVMLQESRFVYGAEVDFEEDKRPLIPEIVEAKKKVDSPESVTALTVAEEAVSPENDITLRVEADTVEQGIAGTTSSFDEGTTEGVAIHKINSIPVLPSSNAVDLRGYSAVEDPVVHDVAKDQRITSGRGVSETVVKQRVPALRHSRRSPSLRIPATLVAIVLGGLLLTAPLMGGIVGRVVVYKEEGTRVEFLAGSQLVGAVARAFLEISSRQDI